MSEKRRRDDAEAETAVPAGCAPLLRALSECHRRSSDAWQREMTCRHLNRSLAECIISAGCPDECEAVRSLCSTAGTSLARTQCKGARISLAHCISSLQDD